MKRLALLAVLWLGCGGAEQWMLDAGPKCTMSTQWCKVCVRSAGFYACGSFCISEEHACHDSDDPNHITPGCACNTP
jgi:hypothetical protein